MYGRTTEQYPRMHLKYEKSPLLFFLIQFQKEDIISRMEWVRLI